MLFAAVAPRTSSKYAGCQPPCRKPPSVSSSGAPGDCITPSRDRNSITRSVLMSNLAFRSRSLIYRTFRLEKSAEVIAANAGLPAFAHNRAPTAEPAEKHHGPRRRRAGFSAARAMTFARLLRLYVRHRQRRLTL